MDRRFCSASCRATAQWSELTPEERSRRAPGRGAVHIPTDRAAANSRAVAVDRGKGGYWTVDRIEAWLSAEADRLGHPVTATDVLSIKRGRIRYLQSNWRPVAPSYDTIRKAGIVLARKRS